MGTGVGELALLQAAGIGAATGAASSAIMGGDPLKGALLGAVGGAIMPGAGAALQGGTQTAANVGAQTAANVGGQAATQAAGQSAFQQAVQNQTAQAVGSTAAPMATQAATQAAVKPTMMQGIGNYLAADPTRAAMIGGTAAPMLTPQTSKLSPFAYEPPEKKKYKGALSRFSYDPSRYTPTMARGGLADTAVARRMMGGGHLGSYSDGGRLLKGPGDGMSDDIPAKIGKKQPARLADGEFVVPADVVSGLGNGSTDAGAKKLYAMMDKVRHARTGTKKQGKQINPQKYMP
jgi:hypothetical protein